MKYLFVHQNYPGQFLHIVRHLVAQKRHDVVFISEPNQNHIEGVRKVVYKPTRTPLPDIHRSAQEFEGAMLRAEAVAVAAETIKKLGYTPDIVIGHHGWGELLNLRDVWPGVPVLGYFEFYYRLANSDVDFDPEFAMPSWDFPRVRAKNGINLLALELNGRGQTPTKFQHSTYPEWARKQISLLEEGANLDICKPDPAARRAPFTLGDITVSPKEKLVTYVVRDLEPYRGFHVMMRALPHLLKARRDVRVILIGGDSVSYGAHPPNGGTWKQLMLNELGDAIDLKRVHFPGRVAYEDFVRLLQRSDAHVYLSYPFVASWSLREALAMGCAVVGSDTPTVTEFIADGRNGVLVPFLEPKKIAQGIEAVLEDGALNKRIRTAARAFAEKHLDLKVYLQNYEALIEAVAKGG